MAVAAVEAAAAAVGAVVTVVAAEVAAAVVAEARTAAVAGVVGAMVAAEAEEAEAHTAAEGPVLTATANHFANCGPPGSSRRAVYFSASATNKIPAASPAFPIALEITRSQLFGTFGVRRSEAFRYRHLLFRHGENAQQVFSNDEMLLFEESPGNLPGNVK